MRDSITTIPVTLTRVEKINQRRQIDLTSDTVCRDHESSSSVVTGCRVDHLSHTAKVDLSTRQRFEFHISIRIRTASNARYGTQIQNTSGP